jgi:uncharacterized cupin superfamily protein
MPQQSSDVPQPCPKCGGEMKQGFIVDNSHQGRFVSTWVPGKPQVSFWMRTKLPDGSLPIGTFHCTACGYLESYARPEFAAE